MLRQQTRIDLNTLLILSTTIKLYSVNLSTGMILSTLLYTIYATLSALYQINTSTWTNHHHHQTPTFRITTTMHFCTTANHCHIHYLWKMILWRTYKTRHMICIHCTTPVMDNSITMSTIFTLYGKNFRYRMKSDVQSISLYTKKTWTR